MAKIADIIRKLRYWGLTGVFNYARNRLFAARLRRVLRSNAHRFPCSEGFERGVTIIAPLSANISLSKVVRDLIVVLRESGIPVQAFDTQSCLSVPSKEVADLVTPLRDFRLCRYPLVIGVLLNNLLTDLVPHNLGIRLATIAFWEFERGFAACYPAARAFGEIIAMSDFNAACFRHELPGVFVRRLLYPFRLPTQTPPARGEIRAKYGLREDEFVVFFNFDFGSGFARKNPDGALRAFAQALGEVSQAKLVFKTMRAAEHPTFAAQLKALAHELGVAERFVMIDRYISHADLYGLTAACDVYLSLHRGEGFGLGIAEAMSLGRPAVVADWSSTTEFCKPDNAYLVPCRLVSLPTEQIDHPNYAHVERWAEPDLDAAARQLRAAYDNPAEREQKGARARAFMFETFSIRKFRASIDALLDAEAKP